MKGIAKFLLFVIILVNLAPVYGQIYTKTEGKQLIDNLYMSKGHLPIMDMILEYNVAIPLGGKSKDALKFVEKTHLIFKKPTKFRITRIINMPGETTQQRIIICDGSFWWQYVPLGQYPVAGPFPVIPSHTLNIPPFIQTFPEDANNIYTYIGTEKIGKTVTKVVKVEDKAGGVITTVWIDPQRWVPIKLVKKIPNPKGGKTIEKMCKYSKFKRLKDGRWFPFMIEVYENGKLSRLLVYKKVSINKGVEDHLFEPMKKFIKP